jgi:hypothetical protein
MGRAGHRALFNQSVAICDPKSWSLELPGLAIAIGHLNIGLPQLSGVLD